MEIRIEQDTNNKLLGRREVHFTATYGDKTPSKAEVKESICKKLNMDPEATEVVKIKQLYGNKSSSIVVYGYETKELMQKMAPKVKEKKAKAGGKEAPKKAEEPKAAPKEEEAKKAEAPK
ncbi:MAG: hypothetical protein KGH72_00380 [Candidatus Micrarchaeota archaeon]|nr:hypothetical protein [Candidatus Micrarchaeota archaeon]